MDTYSKDKSLCCPRDIVKNQLTNRWLLWLISFSYCRLLVDPPTKKICFSINMDEAFTTCRRIQVDPFSKRKKDILLRALWAIHLRC